MVVEEDWSLFLIFISFLKRITLDKINDNRTTISNIKTSVSVGFGSINEMILKTTYETIIVI
jgi:hypothetical protein